MSRYLPFQSPWLCVAASVVATTPGLGYECLQAPVCPAACGEIISGSTQTYRIETTSIPSGFVGAVDEGADMWAAGSSTTIRGASWAFVRGDDVTSAAISNGRPEVFARDDDWWNSKNLSASAVGATVLIWTGCSRTSMDMVLREEMFTTAGHAEHGIYKTGRPSTAAEGHSLPYAVAHEFGHWYGLDHENDFVSLMNSAMPAGGDIGANFRIHENEVSALQDFKADGSTGVNLLVSKFGGPNEGGAFEIDGPTSGYSLSPGECFNAGQRSQYRTQLHLHATSGVGSVLVAWSLSPDNTCGGDHPFGTRGGIGMGMGTPFEVEATSLCAPTNIPDGTYRICVTVDPANDIQETSEDDNSIRFGSLLTIE
jgi:hypothetical protein